MTTVAVIAHSRKQFGGGLTELREVLRAHGVDEPLWYEVLKSKQAPKQARAAVEAGADLVGSSMHEIGDDERTPIALRRAPVGSGTSSPSPGAATP